MENNLERIREEYINYSFDESVATLERLSNFAREAVNFSRKFFIFINRTLQANDKFDDDYVDLQKRVTEGFNWDMEKVFEALDEDSSLELFKLGFFTVHKFCANARTIRNVGFHSATTSEGTLMPIPNDDSLLTEMFFVEKFKEVTGRDLVAENRGKVYEKK